MANEINPEVKAKEAEELKRKEEERRDFAKQLAVMNYATSKCMQPSAMSFVEIWTLEFIFQYLG